jgi:hypothetical protein
MYGRDPASALLAVVQKTSSLSLAVSDDSVAAKKLWPNGFCKSSFEPEPGGMDC